MKIAIVGGGVVGHLLAYLLTSQRDDEVILLDAGQPTIKAKDRLDGRNIALSEGSVKTLTKMGIWKALSPYAYPVDHIHISFRGHAGMTRLHACDERMTHFGATINMADLMEVLISRVHASRAVCHYGTKVSAIEASSDKVTLSFNERTLDVDCLIGCDGARSFVRKALDISHQHKDYKQVAIVGQMRVNKHHQAWAYERFTEHGPLAILPMEAKQVAFVWTVNASDASEILALDDKAFLDAFQEAFGYRAGRFCEVGHRFHYPLHLTVADEVHKGRVVLCGNAAQSLHPVAGQGLNCGIRDVNTLLEMFAQHDVSETALAQYADARAPDRCQIVKLTDSMVWAFTHPSKWVNVAATQALRMIERWPWVKTRLNHHFVR